MNRSALSDLQQDLTTRLQGLVYLSESDAPFSFRALPEWQGTDAPLVDELRPLLGIPEKTPVKSLKINAFFKPLTARFDWFGKEEEAMAVKFDSLKEWLSGQLSDLTVFKAGKREIDYFLLGKTIDNQWVCISTHATETE